MSAAVDQAVGAEAELLLSYSLFHDTTPTAAVERGDVPWSELVARIRNAPTYLDKAHCPLISLAEYGDKLSAKGCIRHAANVERVLGGEIDYDGERVTPAEGAKLLQQANILAALYTSPRHQPDAPRWRVLLPFSEAALPEKRAEYVARANRILGGIAASESFTLSQSFYIGRVQGALYEVLETHGRCIDLAAEIEPLYPAEGLNGAESRYDETTDEELRASFERGAGRYTAMLKLSSRWAARGMAADDIENALAAMLGTGSTRNADGIDLRTRIRPMAESAVRKFGETRTPAKKGTGVPFSPATAGDRHAAAPPAEEPESTQRLIRLRSAAEIIANPAKAAWLIRGVLEQAVLAIVFGDLGTFKSFLALDWALHLAAGKAWLGGTFKVRQCTSIYVSAEGRGLDKRLRGWTAFHQVDVKTLPFYAVEHLLDLSTVEGITGLTTAVEALAIKPELIVVDTLSRNCGPLDEDRSSDMAPFLNRLDELLRVRFGCTVLLVHHTGHAAKERTRGSYALLSNTDASYRVERPDPAEKIIKITTGRLKDCESPEPIYAMGKVVDLGTLDAEGDPESTLVLVATHSRPQPAPSRRPTGKNQAALLTALQEWQRNHPQTDIVTSIELRAIGKAHAIHRKRLQEAAESLEKFGWLQPCVGGYRLLPEPQ